MSKIEENVEKLIKNKIEECNCKLYDLEYVKEGGDYVLRIYIDKKEGINLDDCELVSNSISDILDEADIIKDEYLLEVSSPGIERVLRKDSHFKDNIGELIQIKLFKKDINNQKEYVGNLKDFNKDELIINIKNKDYTIKRQDIAHVKTVYNW